MASTESSKGVAFKTVRKFFSSISSESGSFSSISNKRQFVNPISWSAGDFQQMVIRAYFKDFSLSLFLVFQHIVHCFNVITIRQFIE